MNNTVTIEFVNQLFYEKNILKKIDEDLEKELKEREKISNFSEDSFKEYKLEFMNMDNNSENTYFEIISPKEVKGIRFSVNKNDDLLPYIQNKVNDPFKYIKIDNFNPFDDNMKNNLIVMIAHIDFLNEKFKKEENKYKKIYEGIENKVKKWFLEIDDFDKNFEEEVNKLNKFGEITNKKDLKISHELIAKYNFMNDISRFYRKLTDKMFIQKTEEGSANTYLDLFEKTVYIINSNEGKFKLKPIIIDDRVAQFEIISPSKYKGSYVILKHIPVFILALTAIEPYFTNGILTRYGKSELEFVINEKKFFKRIIYEDLQKSSTAYKNSEYLKFKEFYKKIFESDNKFKVNTPNKSEKDYFYVINQFYEKYADIVSRRYKNTLEIELINTALFSYNVPNKKVYSMSELSGKSPDSLYDLFMIYFINRFVKKHTPLNSLPKPKGSFIMGNTVTSL